METHAKIDQPRDPAAPSEAFFKYHRFAKSILQTAFLPRTLVYRAPTIMAKPMRRLGKLPDCQGSGFELSQH